MKKVIFLAVLHFNTLFELFGLVLKNYKELIMLLTAPLCLGACNSAASLQWCHYCSLAALPVGQAPKMNKVPLKFWLYGEHYAAQRVQLTPLFFFFFPCPSQFLKVAALTVSLDVVLNSAAVLVEPRGSLSCLALL